MSQNEIRLKHASDALWWLVAGAVGLAAARFPDIAYPHQDGTPQIVSHMVLFVAGYLLGAFRSQDPWRWGVATFLALGLADIVHLTSGLSVPELSASDLWMHVSTGAGDWALHALPVLIGAYAGSFLTRSSSR